MTDVAFAERFGLWFVAFGLFVFVVAILSYLFFPAAHWMQVRRLEVRSSVAGQPAEMVYDRTIRREFDGAWRVKVRRFNFEQDGWEAWCSTDWHHEQYRTDSVLPEPVTLEWFAWTDARCWQLPAGTYELRVEWLIHPDGLLRRDVTRTTFFEVQHDPLAADFPP